MAEKVFFVHGWSVDSTTTYQAAHVKLAQYGYELHEVRLGRYVTLDDEVTVPDLARAMDSELVRHLGSGSWSGQRFHIVTHSTGALVARHWVSNLYAGKRTEGRPLGNLVMLAGPQFGSRLAHQGKSQLARIKYGGDTGKQILSALELGSEYSWQLNEQWLDPATWKKKGVRPFCLIGASTYAGFLARTIVPGTAEKGSDGVIRVPAGNLNFRRMEIDLVAKKARRAGEISGVPFGVLETYQHSGPKHGILNSITSEAKRSSHQSLDLLLKCLAVGTAAEYKAMAKTLEAVTRKTCDKKGRYGMIDFRIRDADDRPVLDYSILIGVLQANGELKPAKVVEHTHRNNEGGNRFTMFLNTDSFDPSKTYGLHISATSHTPLVEYGDDWRPLYREDQVYRLCRPNETTQLDVKLNRKSHPNLFVFHPGDSGLPDGQAPDGPPLHVKWNRLGEITKDDIDWK